MQEPEKIDPRELSPLALAFVGDSVLELLVRQRLVEHHRLSAGRLNAECLHEAVITEPSHVVTGSS